MSKYYQKLVQQVLQLLEHLIGVIKEISSNFLFFDFKLANNQETPLARKRIEPLFQSRSEKKSDGTPSLREGKGPE